MSHSAELFIVLVFCCPTCEGHTSFDCFVDVCACVPHGRLIVDCKVTLCMGKVFAAPSPVLWFVIGALEGTSEGRLLTGGGVSCGVVEGPRRGTTDGVMLSTVETSDTILPVVSLFSLRSNNTTTQTSQ